MQPGETVQPGDEILRISTGEDIWVETYLNSQRVASIEPGNRVFVHATGANPIRLPGTVVGISPVMETQPGYTPTAFEPDTERIAIARVQFDDPEFAKQKVRPGQRVTVELLTREPKDESVTAGSR
jgi:multidrug resistance efflux pump